MRGIIVASWILAACATAACSRQDSAWEDAKRENTIAAYQSRLREAEAWARAERLRTPEAWQFYLGKWPDGQFAETARRRLVEFIPPGAPPAGGDFVVQLGAYSTEAAARADRGLLVNRLAAELAGVETRIVPPHDIVDSLWRLRTGALAEPAARELCARLRLGGVDCVPLPDDSAGQPSP